MSATTPITQRDVANACGLHPSTVCLALKNSPSIPELTRRRIQALAEKLGYSPNVAARNLALLRGERKTGSHFPLAWVNQERDRDHWRTDREASVYFQAARQRAEENGYHLEEVWSREPGMTGSRLVQILKARGVEGVLFPVHQSFDFALMNPGWSEFSLMGMNDLRLGEWIDVVSPDYYRNTALALQRLQGLGCGNIGLALTAQFDAATNGLVRSSFLRFQTDTGDAGRCPVLRCGGSHSIEEIEGWLRQHRPDVVLCHERGLCERVRGLLHSGTAVHVGTTGATGGAGALDVRAGEIASAAIDCLIAKMRRFERGVRDATRVQAVRGVWVDGALGVVERVSVVA